MKRHGKHRRYTEEDILAEAREYLKDGVGNGGRSEDAAHALLYPVVAFDLSAALHRLCPVGRGTY